MTPGVCTIDVRNLVLVSSGLELDGGGRALAGRLLGRAAAAFAAARGLGFSVVTLGREAPGMNGPGGAPVRGFGGRSAALAATLAGRQLAGRREAYLFDLLGPARVQAYLPAARRAPYLVPLLGIEAWHPLSRDRSRALAGATAAFAISAHTRERARPFCPGLDGLPVVPLALEGRPPAGAVDAALLERLGEGFLLIVGRMAASERYKGHDELLEVLPRVLARHADGHPGGWLVIAGDGDDRPRLAAKAAALGLGEAVTFAGFVSEATLAELYRRCAAFVMPSRGEGFGLVYLEAMRAGKPCVAATGSAAEEVVVDGETGLLVDPGDREALAAALGRLLADPELAGRMGEAGRRREREVFSEARFRERLEPLLERLISLDAQPQRPSPLGGGRVGTGGRTGGGRLRPR